MEKDPEKIKFFRCAGFFLSFVFFLPFDFYGYVSVGTTQGYG